MKALGLMGLSLVGALGCAHGVRENPMIARAGRDLGCDGRSVQWHAVGDQTWTARGCGKQAQYSVRCHQEFENPARPTYPPIDVCAYNLDGVRPDVQPPAENTVANPPR